MRLTSLQSRFHCAHRLMYSSTLPDSKIGNQGSAFRQTSKQNLSGFTDKSHPSASDGLIKQGLHFRLPLSSKSWTKPKTLKMTTLSHFFSSGESGRKGIKSRSNQCGAPKNDSFLEPGIKACKPLLPAAAEGVYLVYSTSSQGCRYKGCFNRF